MNTKNSLPDVDTMGYYLLEIIAISGEYPSNKLYRITGGESYKYTLITTLKQQNILKTFYRDSLRGLRLTGNAKKKLYNLNPKRYEGILTGNATTNHIKNGLPYRRRLHRIAEATVTIQNAGIEIFRDEKPDVFSPYWTEDTELKITYPVFYNSREIKEIGLTFVKIKGARSVGVLLTVREVFVVYNLGNALMRWDYKSEMYKLNQEH